MKGNEKKGMQLKRNVQIRTFCSFGIGNDFDLNKDVIICTTNVRLGLWF